MPEPEPDEEDTGPLRVAAPSADSGWRAQSDAWAPGQERDAWAGRFDTPLTVSPRQTQRQRNPKLLYAAGGVVAVAVVAGVTYLLLRPSADHPEPPNAAPTTTAPQPTSSPSADEQRLLRMVPRGYAPDSCRPAGTSNEARAQIECDGNGDPGGPASATYTLSPDRAALDAAFSDVVQSSQQVNCPGNIQSPGPWRRVATPDKVAGTLFCGLTEGIPTVAWTDDARLVVSVAHAGPSGPTFPDLYNWWASHS
jgi:hypothetical protein